MQFREFDKTGWNASALGFGTMRLPINETGELHGFQAMHSDKVDESQAVEMVRYAIEKGVNYFDSAYPYHGGMSEKVLGKALTGGYRSKVKIATKFPSWMAQSPDDFERIFEEQRQRLQVDKIDFYLLHALDKTCWPQVRDNKAFQWAEREMSNGNIGCLGFSFHDTYELFKEIIDYYDNWTFCQIQYNYMDENFQAGTRGIRYAARKGLGIVVMEPIRGGHLSNPPGEILKVMDESELKSTPSEWALRWVWNHPEISVVLSGMSNLEQVRQNVASAEKYGNSRMTVQELNIIKRVRRKYRDLISVPCTGCEYCIPCPNGVSIPAIFRLWNEGTVYNDPESAREEYNGPSPFMITPEHSPDACKECRECEEACPQKIPIIKKLKQAQNYLERRAG